MKSILDQNEQKAINERLLEIGTEFDAAAVVVVMIKKVAERELGGQTQGLMGSSLFMIHKPFMDDSAVRKVAVRLLEDEQYTQKADVIFQ